MSSIKKGAANNDDNPDNKIQSKDKKITHPMILFPVFKTRPMSMRMAEFFTSIRSSSISGVVNHWKKNGIAVVYKKDHCHVSGRLVQFITTDEQLFPKTNQTKINFNE